MLSPDRQTDKLTNAIKNITSFAKEVTSNLGIIPYITKLLGNTDLWSLIFDLWSLIFNSLATSLYK